MFLWIMNQGQKRKAESAQVCKLNSPLPQALKRTDFTWAGRWLADWWYLASLLSLGRAAWANMGPGPAYSHMGSYGPLARPFGPTRAEPSRARQLASARPATGNLFAASCRAYLTAFHLPLRVRIKPSDSPCRATCTLYLHMYIYIYL